MKRFNLALPAVWIILLFSGHSLARDELIHILPVSSEEDPARPVSWSLKPTETGLQSVVAVSFDPVGTKADMPGDPIWEYRIELDKGPVLSRGEHSFPENKAAEDISLTRVEDGPHTLRLMVKDSSGKDYCLERKFILDARPEIRIIPQKSQTEIFDPKVQFRFFGESNGFSGSAEFRLDNRPLGNVDIKTERNRVPIPLSTWTGREIFTADLGPGSHLLSVEARGGNASTAVSYHTTRPGILEPKIEFHDDGATAFQKILIRFPASAKAFAGRAEILYNQSVIFSVNAKDQELEINREEILQALETHHLSLKEKPAPFILFTEAAGYIQDWRVFQFQ